MGPRLEICRELDNAVDGRRRHVAQKDFGGCVRRLVNEGEVPVGKSHAVFRPFAGPAKAPDGEGIGEFIGQVDSAPRLELGEVFFPKDVGCVLESCGLARFQAGKRFDENDLKAGV